MLLWNNVYYDTGKTAQDWHNAVGDWYGLPHVSIRDSLYQELLAGRYTRGELTPDGLHPNDKGHALVAGEILRFLEQVRALGGPDAPINLDAPLPAAADLTPFYLMALIVA